MGGRAAVRGFEYQFLCTLESALRAFLASEFELASVAVDAPPLDEPGADPEIVDFGLLTPSGCALAAQVKAGVHGSTLSAVEAVRILLRLLTHNADRYAVITSRRAGAGLQALRELLRRQPVDLRQRVGDLIARSGQTSEDLARADDEWWERLKRADIVLDQRTVDEVYENVRELVRTARHGLVPDAVGWDAAGLLTGYLVAEVLGKAASDGPPLSRAQLTDAIQISQHTLKTLMRQRDWSIFVTSAPHSTDVARDDLIHRIADVLPTPIRGDDVPVCVLTGLSGIGKTSLASAWADDRADSYAEIIWVEAASTGQLEASFAAAGAWYADRGLAGDGSNAREVLFGILARNARPWLLVLDNAVSFRDVKGWIPPKGNGHVIVTTVDPTSINGPHVTMVEVDAMTSPQAVRLLRERLAPHIDLSSADMRALQELGERLLRWPLALELASAYLKDCLGGMAGIQEYTRLVMRSLDDEPSVPRGYPRTLVNAIMLSWRRMCARKNVADEIAADVLRYAAVVAPQKIPLHLMFACVFISERELAEPDTPRGIRVYDNDDPPVGEIVRALKRQSLVGADEPLYREPGSPDCPPGAPAYTVSVNEIVQTILRADLAARGVLHEVLATAAFHVQYWMSYFYNAKRFDHGYSIMGHAVAVSERAIELEVDDYRVALLWGNTAQLLQIGEHWGTCARYLRAELTYFERDTIHHVNKLQTASALAAALLSGTERTATVAEEVMGLLETCLSDVNEAVESDEGATAKALRLALNVVNVLIDSGGSCSRSRGLQAAFTAYCEMLPIKDRVDVVTVMARIDRLIGASRYEEALTSVERALSQYNSGDLERTQLLCVQAECLVRLQKWEPAGELATEFLQAARDNNLMTADAVNFARNVGIACIAVTVDHVEPAAELFRICVAVADYLVHHRQVVNVGDRAVFTVYRAIRALLDREVETCGHWLDRTDLDDLSIADKAGTHKIAHVLLRRWVTAANRQPVHRPGKTRELSSHSLPKVSLVPVMNALEHSSLDGAPLLFVAMSQAHLTGGHSARDPHEVLAELRQALELLGFPARFMRTYITLRREGDVDGVSAEQSHTVLFVDSCARVADPALPHLAVYGTEIARGSVRHALPVVVPMKHVVAGELSVPRDDVVLAYRTMTPVEPEVILSPLSPDQRARADTQAFFIASRCAAIIGVLGDRSEELRNAHPQLRDLPVAVRPVSD